MNPSIPAINDSKVVITPIELKAYIDILPTNAWSVKLMIKLEID